MSLGKEKTSRWRGFFCIYPSKLRISDGDRKTANFVGWEEAWNVGRHFGKWGKRLDIKSS
jgi:hypothetical protein